MVDLGQPRGLTDMNQVRRPLLVSPVPSPAATDYDVLIMNGVLARQQQSRETPSSAS